MLVTILLIERPANRSMGVMRGGVCGIDYRGRGTYTTEGITKLFEGLKRSKTTCLMCAVSPYHMFASSFSTPLTPSYNTYAPYSLLQL